MLPNLLGKYWKHLVAVIIVIIALGSGFYWGRSSVKPTIVTKVDIQEKIVEKVITVEVEKKNTKKDTVTKIIEKPDGTKETIITEKEEVVEESTVKKDEDKSKVIKEKYRPKVVYKPEEQYRIGTRLSTKVTEIFEKPEVDYGVMAGMRVFGPFWLDGTYDFKSRSVGLGISMEF
jgi:thiamine pyrophosphate-dependent acetolactate synthase large subunit-like protein